MRLYADTTLAVVETSRSNWGVTPRESVERECAARGRSVVVDGCVALLSSATDVDRTVIYALGGPPARWAVSGGESGPDYWAACVGGTRAVVGLARAGTTGLSRRRRATLLGESEKQPLRIAARHQLCDLLHDLEALRDDDANRRVASAADRAITRIVAAGT